MCRSNILEVKKMPSGIFPLRLGEASFVYLLALLYPHEHEKDSHPIRISGHSWFERIREKYNSQAHGSII